MLLLKILRTLKRESEKIVLVCTRRNCGRIVSWSQDSPNMIQNAESIKEQFEPKHSMHAVNFNPNTWEAEAGISLSSRQRACL